MGKFSSRVLPDLSYEHIDIFTKKRVASRDLGNRASPVDRAHMKRPLIWNYAIHSLSTQLSTWLLRHPSRDLQ